MFNSSMGQTVFYRVGQVRRIANENTAERLSSYRELDVATREKDSRTRPNVGNENSIFRIENSKILKASLPNLSSRSLNSTIAHAKRASALVHR
jgi:hypothetical protein